MRAKDYKKSAWSKMHGKWGVCALITFILSVIGFATGGLSAIGIGVLLLIFVEMPLEYSASHVALSVCRGEKVEFGDAFAGFKIYWKALCLNLLMGIFIFLWSCLFIIPGIIKIFSYSMSNFILRDNPNMTASEAITESRRMMNGNKWRLFCLCFSFIGWFILSIFTCGILLFWITPYMNASIAEFYRSLKNENDTSVDTVESAEVEDTKE